MKKPVFQTALLYAGLAGAFVLFDLALDRLIGGPPELDWPHLVLATLVVLSSFVVLSRAVETRKRGEALLRQARDELEIRVQERTAELARANEALQAQAAERERAQVALRESQEGYQLLFNTMLEGFAVHDIICDEAGRPTDYRFLEVNPAFGRLTGLGGSEIVGKTVRQVLPGIESSWIDLYGRVALTGEPIHFENYVRELGRYYWVTAFSPKRGQFAALFQDITERKQMEEALQESKRKLDTMFQTLVDGMVVVDLDGQIIYANRAAGRILDIHQDAMIGKYYSSREWRQIDEHGQPYPLDQLPLAVALQERRQVGPVEHPIIAPNGEMKWLSVNAAPLLDENGQLYGAVASFRDITERKQMESELHKRTRDLDERVKELKCLFDISELIAKPGIALEEILQGTVDLVPNAWQYPEITCVRINLEERTFRTENWQDSTWKQSRDIMVRGERVGAVEVCYLEERPAGDEGPFLKEERSLINAIAERLSKITERNRAEEALRHAQDELEQRIQERTALEERQRLARELHDSVSQALYGISLGAHTALTWLDRDRGKVVEALDYVLSLTQAGLTEMRALIFELRPESLETEGLVAALNHQAAALRARHEIEVELELCDEPNLPLETKEALYRIAQEALQNAVRHARPSRLEVRLVCDAESIVLQVCDDGVGFDPSASFPGHLGLRSMHERATRRGGTLDIVSAPGSGTRIRACIPLSAAPAELSARDRRNLT